MTNMDLFVHEQKLSFEKVANAQLDEDPEAWPRQILVELFRQAPDASDYSPRVAMLKVDKEQGYGLGVVLLESATDSALATATPSPSTKRCVVPVVVRNHQLSPLDLIMTRSGKMTPLNPHRLREALFRAETFDTITDDWGDTNLYNLFYPPGRSDNDFGSGIAQNSAGSSVGYGYGSGMKLSAEEEFILLPALLPTILGTDLDELIKQASETPEAVRGAVLPALQILSGVEKTALRDSDAIYRAALDIYEPTVVQVGYDPAFDIYWTKSASSRCYGPLTKHVSRAEILKIASPEVVRKVDTEGTVTVTPSNQKVVEPPAEKFEVIEKPGIYRVQTTGGKDMTGWVIPSLVDVDGTQVPMALFTNGAVAMVQSQIVGTKVSEGVNLPEGPPRRTGCFYVAGPDGVLATVPLKVQGREEKMEGGSSYLVRTLTGEDSQVRIVPGLKKIVASKGELMLPGDTRFLPLDEETMVPLLDTPTTKTSSFQGCAIRLHSGDDRQVSIDFQWLPKLASYYRGKTFSHDEAVFALGAAGVPAQVAVTKVAQAATGESVHVHGVQDVTLQSDVLTAHHKEAEKRSSAVRGLRQLLLKEAAAMPTILSVDSVLSLGFINSENVRMYVSRMPYLEKALSHVCELLLGSRLGLVEIPEFAAGRCARGLDDVLQGLRALSMRDVEESRGD